MEDEIQSHLNNNYCSTYNEVGEEMYYRPDVEEAIKTFNADTMEQNERLSKAMLDSAHNLIQFVAVELRGEKLSDEDIESMIHDYVHPKKETKKE